VLHETLVSDVYPQERAGMMRFRKRITLVDQPGIVLGADVTCGGSANGCATLDSLTVSGVI
jgi:hypothetical protein